MSETLDEQEALRRLLDRSRAVLFDFDGPVTDLFGDASTAPVAREIKEVVRSAWGTLDPDVEDCDDSHDILRHVRDMFERPALVPRSRAALEQAEAIVTQHEYVAVKTAEPTPHIVELVDVLTDLGIRLVIVSNNSDGPVLAYVRSLALQSKFDAVLGRDPHELRHMKPDPDAVNRAVDRLDLPASVCLVLGDQLTDLAAAQAAGTRFIGYTQSAQRAAEMRERGADWVVSSHQPLISAAEQLSTAN
ncbi:HAD superfamily hydrolase (TIGR01509 family) [Streptomyces aurantiacus]|uniref:HAD family hydrolase n=1 Tax=Streptomyces aurantiacus TaxID=47760 RepID=UPI002790ECE6|nr:HAD-IA family hydrolase [Streptomyces aurantiacus]MDQ0775631.1 HAD superfamily hydrolase (TIGR01509 family) [Streptomyces aurantiacus]